MNNEKITAVDTASSAFAEVLKKKWELTKEVEFFKRRLADARKSKGRAQIWLTLALIPYTSVAVVLLTIWLFK